MDRLLNVKEVCGILDMHRATIYRKVKSGELDPPKKIGRSTKWPESSIKKYLAGLKSL
ncbi:MULTISPECIES: helix-turn-helix transcriptional regulator [Atlantibacter]|uniref:helix-turn-helix transcriptional regulator n=1 Tax=Atlantibacter TaxID=1903434 RepID=UPI002073FB60|nr:MULTISPECIES: helix-turn-helix domain-containing protein [Atlantibacter]